MHVGVRFFGLAVMIVMTLSDVLAQRQPVVSTRWGALLGGNFNMAGIGWAQWVSDPKRPGGQFGSKVYNDGQGGGLYGGLSFQTAVTDALHFGLRAMYDNRSLLATDESYRKGDGVQSAEAATYFSDDYQFNMSYAGIEPHVKFFLDDNLHLTAGVGLGASIQQKFDYTPEESTEQKDLDVARTGTVKHALTASGFAGAGYDIFLSDPAASTQWILTPFVEASYLVGQRGTNFTDQNAFNDGMSTISIRGGISIAFGSAPIVESAMEAPYTPAPTAAPPPGKLFRATEPREGVYAKRIERADFPLRPYVFFDRGSAEIPDRYVKLTRDQARGFANTASTTPIDVSDVEQRPKVQRNVYYNILNYMGWRLTSQPGSSMELYASDPDGRSARAMAESVQKYLVDVWGVRPEQLKITTGDPEPRSGTSRSSSARLADENRRVQFRALQPDRLGARVMVTSVRPAEMEHQMLVDLSAVQNLSSWGARIEGNGTSRSFGPFTQASAYLDPTGLLQPNQRSGKFTLSVNATTRDGQTRTESEQLTLVRTDQESTSLRHRLNFEFNEEDPVARSKNFLLTDVIPAIRNGSRVNIYGHTDEIGRANLELSMKRADQVMEMMKQELSARGVRNVKFTSNAVGEDEPLFDNDTPEGRMYNRTVVIDIIP